MIRCSQLKIRLGCVLKALVTVEVQAPCDLFLFPGSSDRRKHKIDILFGSCAVGNDAVVIKVTNNGKIEEALIGSDIRNVRHPFLVGTVCVEIPCQQIIIFVDRSGITVIFPASDFCKKIIFLHHPKNCLRIFVDSMSMSFILGTIGGDDTVLIVMRDANAAAAFCNEIRNILN